MSDQLSPPISIKVLLTFPEALNYLIEGKQITRDSWNDNSEYGILADGWLTIHTKGAFHVWKVSDGDLLATDWKVL